MLALFIAMDFEDPKRIPPEPAVCFPNRSEESSQNKRREEEVEMERCKQPRATEDNEGSVDEFLCLLDRIQERKKLLKRKRTNSNGASIGAGGGINAVEEDEMLMAMASMQQAQGSSDAVNMISYDKSSSTSPWNPSFQWEDFNITAEADSGDIAVTEKNKDKEGSIQIGNRLL